MKYIPRIYQEHGRKFIIRNRAAAVFEDMGLGKTVQALTALLDLQAGLDVRAMLVLAPIRVCESVWPAEVAQWDHTRGLKCSILRGSPVVRTYNWKGLDLPTKPAEGALDALAPGHDIYLTNYENVAALCEWMDTQKTLPFDMLVLDESTKMKSHAAQRFKLLKPHLRKFKRHVIMSGTPMPNSYIDLWAQFYILDRGKALGDRFTHFRDRWFDYNPYSYKTTLRDGAAAAIRARIRPKVLCLRSADWIKLPPIITTPLVVPLTTKVRKLYDTFEKELTITLDGIRAEALTAATLQGKCRQLTSGAMYETPILGTSEPKRWRAAHTLKMEAVEEIIDSAQSDPCIVVYEFRHELERLLKLYPKARTLEGKTGAADKAIRDWNARKVPVLLLHPASAGHGLNLQHGGRRIIFTSGTYSADMYEQMVKRLHRSGQTQPVLVYRLVCPDTVDEEVQKIMDGKIKTQGEFLEAMKARQKRRKK